MEKIELTRDDLFHNRIEKMTDEQQSRFDLMLQINHFVNCALEGNRERSTGRCLPIKFTDFLERLRVAYDETVERQSICKSILVYDDFIRVANFSFDAIRDIVSNPSTHIEKISVKEIANRATNFGNKTVKWLSQRPGSTIQEKISPQNRVLTSKTIFSVDTKENRELMYLYRILHEALSVRMNGIACATCSDSRSCKYYEWVKKAKKLNAMNIKIKSGELSAVKPIKQSQQNNKLMCDKNYKIVWDSVKMLSHIEDTIKAHYENNLIDSLARLLYWLMLAELLRHPNIKISDTYGTVENEGTLSFISECGSSYNQNQQPIILTDEFGNFRKQYLLENRENVITLWDSNAIIFRCDISKNQIQNDKVESYE